MKYIAVFCSAREVDDVYVTPAREFANLLIKNNYNLVWGGSDVGLMKVIADEVEKGGGKLFGVSYTTFQDVARKNADEMIVAKTLDERKRRMLEKADAIVCLVGGMGTLDEITEIIELKKAARHNKPIAFLNTNNFYEGFFSQIDRMDKEGFIRDSDDKMFMYSESPQEIIDFVNKELSDN